MNGGHITIKGAREHNLKDVDLEIPRNRFVVITGVSGSGKSTLAFDTLYAEGQRRYVESLSAYARQFLGQMKKPDADLIEGLSPAISIDQKRSSKNPRSTVGTQTEIYDYLRLLYARIGEAHCYECGKRIDRQSSTEIVDSIMLLGEGTRIMVLAPVVNDRKGEHHTVVESLRLQGFTRVRVDGTVFDEDEDPGRQEKYKRHTVEAVVDRMTLRSDADSLRRLADSVETALKTTDGMVRVWTEDGERQYSEHFACVSCGISFEQLAPRNFSFNSPHGACPDCDGLGVIRRIDPRLIIPDGSRSLMNGAFAPMRNSKSFYIDQTFMSLGQHYGFDPHTPWEDLPEEFQDVLLHGSGNEAIPWEFKGKKLQYSTLREFEGLVNMLERRHRETQSERQREEYESWMSDIPCALCKGSRLRRESSAVKVKGVPIHDLTGMTIKDAWDHFDALEFTEREESIAQEVVKEIKARLSFMLNVGLDYLSLSRRSATLSGGESQRIRLATQIGSGLVGVLYILDEPSIGLHPRDNRRLTDMLHKLKDLGNTLIIVEHDESTMMSADHLIDLGPGAGVHGGVVVAQGTPEEVKMVPGSLTGQYLRGDRVIPVPRDRRKGKRKFIVVKGAAENNLQDIEVRFPLGKFVCVTGVSGSGKSSLVNEILYKSLARTMYNAKHPPGRHKGISGLEHIDKVVIIDQSPIGRTPRSNPATYTGTFTPIREIFAKTKLAKQRGYNAGRFSFNVKGGRCEGCQGAGIIKIEMHFLPDVYIPCEICKGKRYNRETLDVRYKDRNIYEVLDMTVEEGFEFFRSIPALSNKLGTLVDVGLGYIRLGQPATTLSGGEAQRVKLSTELSRRSTGKTVYILDEPTTGLHFEDIRKLLDVLGRLADSGNTVITIEHNLDVIKTADHIIDLGPEGGDRGGKVVATGTPEVVARSDTYTGRFLKEELRRARELSREHPDGDGAR